MPINKEFALVAGWVLKIINSHEYWTPNPYTLMLHNPCDIFHEYAQRRFKVPPPELLDAQDRFYKALLDISDTAVLQEVPGLKGSAANGIKTGWGGGEANGC